MWSKQMRKYNTEDSCLVSDAHPQSQITRLVWLDDETLVSVGQDCNTKVWKIATVQ